MPTTGIAGAGIDITPENACYVGAAVVGATVVVGSVAITTVAAPGIVLVPLAISGGLVAAGMHVRDNNALDETDRQCADANTNAVTA